MKAVAEIEELMRKMGRRTRRMAARKYALTREELFKIQSAVRAATSSSSAPPVSEMSRVSGKVSNQAAVATSKPATKPGGKPGYSKQFLEKIVQEIRSSGDARFQTVDYKKIPVAMRPKIDTTKADKEINRYLQLKEKLGREVGGKLLTNTQAEGRLLKARDHLKAKLLASGVIKIDDPHETR
jgi:hypothetical protein